MGTDLKDGVGAPAATNILFVTLKAIILYSYAVRMFSTMEYKTHTSVILKTEKTSIKPQILKRCKKFCSTTFKHVKCNCKNEGFHEVIV
jgi:hypothetical protein